MGRTADLDSLYENNSGQGKNTPVPPELRKWNWGALCCNVIWGLANDTYIALLCMIPIVGFVMPFVLGAKGSEWAWQNRRWRSIAHFQKVQRGWAIASLAVFVFVGAGMVIMIMSFSSMLGGVGEVRALAEQRLNNSPAAIEVLGEPIKIDRMPSFNVNESAAGSRAELTLLVSGPLDSGTLRVEAVGGEGQWEFTEFSLAVLSEEIDILAAR